ncbi:hypothetical protein QF047_002276 [Arthrobacter sp. W4I7]|nr:hypothetical protein [Arthrobacter sp. W4I7]
MAYSDVWAAGQCPGWWAPRLLCTGVGGSSFRFCRVGLGWPTPVHGFAVRERHDEASLVRNGLGRPLLAARGRRGRLFVRPREVWTMSTPPTASWSGRRGRVTVRFRDMNSYRRCQKRKEPSPAGHPSHHRLPSGWAVQNLNILMNNGILVCGTRNDVGVRYSRRLEYLDPFEPSDPCGDARVYARTVSKLTVPISPQAHTVPSVLSAYVELPFGATDATLSSPKTCCGDGAPAVEPIPRLPVVLEPQAQRVPSFLTANVWDAVTYRESTPVTPLTCHGAAACCRPLPMREPKLTPQTQMVPSVLSA